MQESEVCRGIGCGRKRIDANQSALMYHSLLWFERQINYMTKQQAIQVHLTCYRVRTCSLSGFACRLAKYNQLHVMFIILPQLEDEPRLLNKQMVQTKQFENNFHLLRGEILKTNTVNSSLPVVCVGGLCRGTTNPVSYFDSQNRSIRYHNVPYFSIPFLQTEIR